ncbi:MAG: glycolate oxidase subunit GlcE [Pseudomonadota bacterium]
MITTEAELAEVVRSANGPLRIQGGGTRAALGAATEGAPLSTVGLSEISIYEPEALTLVTKAGTPLAEVEQALSDAGQMLFFEPPDYRKLLGSKGTPTIGSVAACNLSGPRRVAQGAARDAMLGVRFVDGRGDVISNGGRVMKNVTGYDLVKLMAGSYGTLGVLTEVSFKTLPKPEDTATLVLHRLNDEAGVRALIGAMGSPNDVTGAAYDAQKQEAYIRIEGFKVSIKYRSAALKTLFSKSEQSFLSAKASSTLWKQIRDVAPLAKQKGDVWRISTKPTDAPDLVATLHRSMNIQALYDWSGGLIWLLTPEGADIREKLKSFDGHATLIRGKRDGRPVFHPQSAIVEKMSQGLREKFDPKGLFNPGIMG